MPAIDPDKGEKGLHTVPPCEKNGKSWSPKAMKNGGDPFFKGFSKCETAILPILIAMVSHYTSFAWVRYRNASSRVAVSSVQAKAGRVWA